MISFQRSSAFSNALQTSGLNGAVRALNDGVPHRYTAVYTLDAGTLRNVALFDKQGEMVPAFLEAVPLDLSFCQFVIRDGQFSSSDSAEDRRLDGHPYQGVVVSYHGVPLVDSTGDICGTLCHFDVNVLDLPDEEFALLQKAARSLPPFLRNLDRRHGAS